LLIWPKAEGNGCMRKKRQYRRGRPVSLPQNALAGRAAEQTGSALQESSQNESAGPGVKRGREC
jgi:hypothetical protein